jgi:hypothetical protein
LRQQIRRQVASMVEPDDDIRFVILTSTIVPNRNWFVLATTDEFIVVRAARLRLRAIDIKERLPRGLLQSRITPTLRHAIAVGTTDHCVSRLELPQLREHNDDYVNNARASRALDSHAAKIAALRQAVKDYEQSLNDMQRIATRSDDLMPTATTTHLAVGFGSPSAASESESRSMSAL